ncbi:MAG: hypothetical protein IKQ24_01130 [Verrucomicrobia bacterium]|nr:hypothetical protein [Verrucomicrobiota bacterium]
MTQSDMGVVIWQPKTKITYAETIALDAVATVNDVVIASGDELSYTVKYEGEVYPLEEGMILNAGEYEVMAEYVAPLGGGYADARTEWIGVTVFQAVPVLTWTPAAMNYGEAPASAQMNAEADVEGTFEYPEMSGLDAGEYSMTAIFIPEDSNYAVNTVEAVLVVNPIAPVITWAAPAPITDDTALSDAQLNATANVEGTFVYAPKAGTVLEAGTYTLTTVFTPTSKNYTQAAVSVELVVEPSVEVELTWETPAPIEYGTPLSEAQLNAKANVEGDFYYNPAFGTVLDGGVHKLSVVFKPANEKYKNQYKEVELVVKGDEEPKIISYKVDLEAGTMTIEFTCKLYESEDGKNWTLVEGAKDTYTVSLKQSKTKFYCAGK